MDFSTRIKNFTNIKELKSNWRWRLLWSSGSSEYLECTQFKKLRKFKTRALKRHEKFNGHMKVFECLSNRFRSGKEKFAACFEAVAVICQYQIENDKPMFDVLIQDILT